MNGWQASLTLASINSGSESSPPSDVVFEDCEPIDVTPPGTPHLGANVSLTEDTGDCDAGDCKFKCFGFGSYM